MHRNNAKSNINNIALFLFSFLMFLVDMVEIVCILVVGSAGITEMDVIAG